MSVGTRYKAQNAGGALTEVSISFKESVMSRNALIMAAVVAVLAIGYYWWLWS